MKFTTKSIAEYIWEITRSLPEVSASMECSDFGSITIDLQSDDGHWIGIKIDQNYDAPKLDWMNSPEAAELTEGERVIASTLLALSGLRSL